MAWIAIWMEKENSLQINYYSRHRKSWFLKKCPQIHIFFEHLKVPLIAIFSNTLDIFLQKKRFIVYKNAEFWALMGKNVKNMLSIQKCPLFWQQMPTSNACMLANFSIIISNLDHIRSAYNWTPSFAQKWSNTQNVPMFKPCVFHFYISTSFRSSSVQITKRSGIIYKRAGLLYAPIFF